jgi:exonuclease SbcC
MIPLRLSLSGFLSYREPVELDFTGFDMACISGANGAGKSSILDAITWVVFGEARAKDEAIINAQAPAAEVIFEFSYESNVYCITRYKARKKTAQLEFQIRQSVTAEGAAVWKPLTERSKNETQRRINETLRLDYDTFVNAAFFLQRDADNFTAHPSGDRKKILSSILGLDIWEDYRKRAFERGREVASQIKTLDSLMAEDQRELSEEGTRRQQYTEAKTRLEALAAERTRQDEFVNLARRMATAIETQSQQVASLGQQLRASQATLASKQARQQERAHECESLRAALAHAAAIRAAHADWQAARQDLEAWDALAERFHSLERALQTPREALQAARAARLHEQDILRAAQGRAAAAQTAAAELAPRLAEVRTRLTAMEQEIARLKALAVETQAAKDTRLRLEADNKHLFETMTELKTRVGLIEQMDVCPTCEQSLPSDRRADLVATLTAEGTGYGEKFRAQKTEIQTLAAQIQRDEKDAQQLAPLEREQRALQQNEARLASQLESLAAAQQEWTAAAAARLDTVAAELEAESYAPEARAQLAQLEAERAALGYDPATHTAARQREQVGRAAETELRTLERAEAALAPVERELASLGREVAELQEAVTQQQRAYDEQAAALAAAQASTPQVKEAEALLNQLVEQENRLRQDLGGLRQRVEILADLKERRKQRLAERESLGRLQGHYEQLTKAFGKDGVPALLIEQALPEIEEKANDILDRLSGGTMTVRFITQKAYQDERRDDLRETLEILISDQAGSREYAMFSGGEGFRVNFAIRLALSEVLAQRAGARLQTLVIDEGFGSQDAQGRQRLVEAINLVQERFAKIIIITHIDELKDSFPNRIEVEKTPTGSTLRVV